AVGVAAAALWEDGADGKPAAAGPGDVAQDSGRAGDLGGDEVGGAVVIEVGDDEAAADDRRGAQGRVALGDVLELAAAGVGEELVALSVAGPKRAVAVGAAVAVDA